MCALWGEFWTDDSLLRLAETALARVLALRRRVLALKDTVLYREVGSLRRHLSLRMTNVLTHDPLYRNVAELWMAWEMTSHVDETPEERWAKEQRAARGFEHFGQLLVVRALDFLGYVDLTDSTLGTPSRSDLEGPAGVLQFQLASTGGVVIRSALLQKELHIVSVASCLDAAPPPQQWLTRDAGRRTLVLFLEADEKRGTAAQRVALSGPGPRVDSIAWVPVAPWALESVERLARAIRFWLWGELFLAYPFSAPAAGGSWRPPALPDHIVKSGASFDVVRPVSDGQIPGFVARRQKAEDRVREIEPEIAALADVRGKKKGLLKGLKAELASLNSSLDLDHTFEAAATRAMEQTRQLLTCPICDAENSPYGFTEVDGRFRVRCENCSAIWGKRDCGCCGSQVPYLVPSGVVGAVDPLEIDEAYGCDIIAFPRGPDAYLCTSCGGSTDGAVDAAS